MIPTRPTWRCSSLAEQLETNGQAAVLAGSPPGSGSGSAIDELSAAVAGSQLSSVDNANTEIGQIMVAQALNLLLTGHKAASYGVVSGRRAEPGAYPFAVGEPSALRRRAGPQAGRGSDEPGSAQDRRDGGERDGGELDSATTGALAAGAARAIYAALNSRPPGSRAVWTRTNHRGEQVTLLEGPAVAAGAVTAAALASALPARGRGALAAAGAGAAVFGCYDDLAGGGDRRGFRGHLGALAGGELTTGAVKIGGIGGTGIVASLLVGGSAPDVVINAGLVAGGANLLNLFDLRPGRAIKVALAAGSLIAAGPAPRPARGGGTAGRGRRAASEDLGERAMLGDAGANALGAMLGTAAAIALPRTARVAVLAAVAGLTAASEVVSFTKVIERTPPLRWLDMLGRRPRPGQPPRYGAVRRRSGRAGPGRRRSARAGRFRRARPDHRSPAAPSRRPARRSRPPPASDRPCRAGHQARPRGSRRSRPAPPGDRAGRRR